jgi:NADPH:quinone reductase-like Zn-dependent oxidoreductase
VKAVVFTGAGGTEVVAVQERPDPVAAKGEVVVESVYAGVNPADRAQMAGKYPVPLGSPKDIPGLEVSGTVVEVGADVSRWKVGDRVFGVVGGGGLASRVAVHERHVAGVPDVLDDLQAAAIPEAYVTAHDAIVTQAGLRMGERLLVNGASGGVGLAAVQIGLATGATVFAYARSAEAREKLAALGAIPVASPQEASDIQVVLELVGAPNMEANFKAIAVLGRIIVVGNGAGVEFTMNLRTLMSKRGRLMGTLLRARPIEQKADAVLAFERQIVPQIASGRCTAIIDKVFPLEQAAAAYDRLAESGKYGKVLINVGE